jgi:hypothetical protein
MRYLMPLTNTPQSSLGRPLGVTIIGILYGLGGLFLAGTGNQEEAQDLTASFGVANQPAPTTKQRVRNFYNLLSIVVAVIIGLAAFRKILDLFLPDVLSFILSIVLTAFALWAYSDYTFRHKKVKIAMRSEVP